MKLLPKQEVTGLKSQERKFEIDEGAKLAKTIDKLRQLSAEEQVRLSKFREETLGKLRNDTLEEASKKDKITLEITELEKKRIKLLLPLDKEYAELYLAKEECRVRENRLNERELILLPKEVENDRKTKENETERKKIIITKEKTDKLLQNAQESNRDAELIKVEANKFKEVQNLQITEREQAVTVRENVSNIRELDLNNWANSLKNKEIEQSKRERAINDKYETLLRSQSRLKNNGKRI